VRRVSMSGALSLVEPTLSLGGEALAMLNEIGTEDGGFQGLERPLTSETLAEYIARIGDQAGGRNLPSGFVPMNTYCLLHGVDRLLGISRLRHRLTNHRIRP
jgi:predicted acetyltransferase